jgi:hypothetical protein
MLTAAPGSGALIKETKRNKFYIEKCILFKFLKERLHKSQDFYTLFSSLTSIQGH